MVVIATDLGDRDYNLTAALAEREILEVRNGVNPGFMEGKRGTSMHTPRNTCLDDGPLLPGSQ